MKLSPEPVATKWNFWFNAATKYHSFYLQFYEGFFKQEKSHGITADRILELVDDSQIHHASFHNLHMNVHFINENCTHLIKVLTSSKETLACVAYNMEDIKQYLYTGTSKSTFGQETDYLLPKRESRRRRSSQISKIFSAHLFWSWTITWMSTPFTRQLICLILNRYPVEALILIFCRFARSFYWSWRIPNLCKLLRWLTKFF